MTYLGKENTIFIYELNLWYGEDFGEDLWGLNEDCVD